MKRKAGTYVEAYIQGLKTRAFVPHPLPPAPPIAWTPELAELRDAANQGLGRLDGITRILPDNRLFLYQYVRKEAVLSSQIEDSQTSLQDLLLYELREAPGVPLDDVREVSNYVAALDHGLQQLRTGGLPLSLRLIREMHAVLLRQGRGKEKDPGEFRRSQVFIGSRNPPAIRFVPPPPNRIMDCLDPLENFLHNRPERVPTLLKAALTHVQFETIHPFKDGNGRVGRLLITLLLCAEQALTEPMLYLSLYFKQHREQYYDCLQRVRTEGDWEGWLAFFFSGVVETAHSAVDTAERLLALFARDRERLQGLGKAAGSAIRIHQLLQERPIVSIPDAAGALSMSWQAVRNAMKRLEGTGLVNELTGQKRGRLYAYGDYLAVLSEGTEPYGAREEA